MPASVRRSSAHAARLSRRSVYMSAAPADASAMVVVTSITTINLPARLRRALRMDRSPRHGRRTVLKILLSLSLRSLILPSYRKYGPLQAALSYKVRSEIIELSKERRVRKRFSPMCMLMTAIAIIGVPLSLAAQFSVETVKAAYLFRFAQYVEWPPLATDAPFVIAVSGAEDVAA